MKDPQRVLLPEYHPLLPNPTEIEALTLCKTEAGRRQYAEWLDARKKRIQLAHEDEGDPYHHGWRLECWKKADRELKRSRGQYVAGGKRATKSERAAWLMVKAAMMLPKCRQWIMQGSGKTAIAEQHLLIWKYLPKEIKGMNGRSRHGWAKIDYVPDRGFANNILVLPNRSEMHFLTYNMDYKEYQGWKIGAELTPELQRLIEIVEDLHNLGGWADEDMPLPWLETMRTRCVTRNAKWIWTFSTMDGITPAIQSLRGTPEVIESAPAELLPQNQVHVKGLPPGHMPLVERAPGNVSICYFWTQFNPFPPNYEGLKELVEGKPRDRIIRDAYGYDVEAKNKAYPKFSRVNIIKPEELPEHGTNYKIVDPAGRRKWATVWVRVVWRDRLRMYFYRDWPAVKDWGEWAKPAPTNEHPDGVEGTAQKGLGWGWAQYKKEWLRQEHIPMPTGFGEWVERRDEMPAEVLEAGLLTIRDPYRRRIFKQAWLSGTDPNEVQETILRNYMDPRAGAAPSAMLTGSTTHFRELAKEHRDPNTGELIAAPMIFLPASGINIDTGFTAVNELLNWEEDEPFCPIQNEPALYVSDECEQLIGMFSCYTGLGGEKGGWRDFSDLVRYAATSNLVFVGEGPVEGRAGGSY